MEENKIVFSEDQIFRLICQLLAHELSQQRRLPIAWQQLEQWQKHTPISEAGCGADSLEILAFRVRVELFFQLQDTESPPILDNLGVLGDWCHAIYNAINSGIKRVGFLTSGSTGTPKQCVHHSNYLLQETKYLADLFKTRRRIVALTPSYHIYGFLFSVLLPSLMKIEVLDATALSSTSLISKLEPGDLLVGFPDYWKLWLKASLQIPHNIGAVSSTGFCEKQIKQKLVDYGVDPLIEIYGSSETGGVGHRIWPQENYCLFSYWHYHNNSLWRNKTEANKCNYTLMDQLEWTDSTHFTIQSRLDNQVQIAGLNVSPSKVENCLCEHPDVRTCAVRKMRVVEGDRLKAYIVTKQGQDIDKLSYSLTKWVNEALPAVERPKHFSFGNQIPKDEQGKLVDWSIENVAINTFRE